VLLNLRIVQYTPWRFAVTRFSSTDWHTRIAALEAKVEALQSELEAQKALI